MKSLTYELTTVYADQIVNNMHDKQQREAQQMALEYGIPVAPKKQILQRIRSERYGERYEKQMR